VGRYPQGSGSKRPEEMVRYDRKAPATAHNNRYDRFPNAKNCEIEGVLINPRRVQQRQLYPKNQQRDIEFHREDESQYRVSHAHPKHMHPPVKHPQDKQQCAGRGKLQNHDAIDSSKFSVGEGQQEQGERSEILTLEGQRQS